MKAHERLSEITERRIRQGLGEEVSDIQVRAKELHTQLALPDVITNFEVPEVQMLRSLSGRHWVVDCLSRALVVDHDRGRRKRVDVLFDITRWLRCGALLDGLMVV